MSQNKASTRSLQAKQIPLKLRILCRHALELNFLLAHVPDIDNSAADYFSRLDLAPTDKIHLKLSRTESISIHNIELDLASQTPEQVDSEEDFHPDSTFAPDSAANPQPNAEDINALLMMVGQRDDESKKMITSTA